MAFPPGLGGAIAITLNRLRIGAERGFLFPANGREILFGFKENLTEVENIEEEEEHNDGQAKRVDAIDSFADDEWVEFPSPRVQFG